MAYWCFVFVVVCLCEVFNVGFFACVVLAKACLVVGPLPPSVRPSHRNTFGEPSLCNLVLPFVVIG